MMNPKTDALDRRTETSQNFKRLVLEKKIKMICIFVVADVQ